MVAETRELVNIFDVVGRSGSCRGIRKGPCAEAKDILKRMRMSVLATRWEKRIHNATIRCHIIGVVWGGEIDMMSRVERTCVVGLEQSRMGNRPTRPSAFYSSTHPGQMVKPFGSRRSAHLGWQYGQLRSTMGSRTLSHKFVHVSGDQ